MGSIGPSAIQRLPFIPLPEVTSWWKIIPRRDEIKDEVEMWFRQQANLQAVTPKCLGRPPVDRDQRNAHPGFREYLNSCDYF
ncbi:hypothetical protein TNCV_5087121 [Trichonephila clavipes]|nr:hypothetical protein TNCV_5087121 [Trichonephila clavipes]